MGLLVVPQSLARLHHRKDLKYVPLTDAPQSRVALSWPDEDENSELMEHMIGIVRGRTVNSTRGAAKEQPKEQPKKQQRSPAPRQQKKQPAKRAKPRRR